MTRFTLRAASALAVLLFFAAGPALAQDTTITDTTMQADPPPMQDTTMQDDMVMQDDTADATSTETVVGVIQQSPDHTTLASALEAAGLIEALEDSGPFAVLAPTDAAFEALPTGRLDSLLLPQNQDELRALLRHHVLVGDLSAERLATRIENGRGRVETVQGDSLQFSAQGGTVMVDGATATETDLPASNGLVHVIDAVLVPATQPAQPGAMQEDPMQDDPMQEDSMEDDMMEEDTSMQAPPPPPTPEPDTTMPDTSMSDTPGANR